MQADKQYLSLLREVMENGTYSMDRTGTGTLSIFGAQRRYNLQNGFPLLTTKKVHFKSVVHELLWFLSGDTNIKYLKENGVRIWDEWADENGDLGPVYGAQWRSFGGRVDQISNVVESLTHDPQSRRHIVSAWNPCEIGDMALPPCHTMFQFYVSEMKLSCQLYQRSADIFLGVPFNIASYALLTHLIADQCGYAVGEFVHTMGDVHLYANHQEQARTQLEREPFYAPNLHISRTPGSIFDYKYEDIQLQNYQCHPGIKAKVAV